MARPQDHVCIVVHNNTRYGCCKVLLPKSLARGYSERGAAPRIAEMARRSHIWGHREINEGAGWKAAKSG